MNWLTLLTLILEFLRTILKERNPTLARVRTVYRSKRFRKWLLEEKGIELED